jgi:hypothetical protein
MVRLKRTAALLAVAALALAVGGSQASGSVATTAKHKKHKKHKKKKKKQPRSEAWASSVTLRLPTLTHFDGSVGSPLAACRTQRLVAVYYTDPGTAQVLPLSVQRTDSAGNFAFDLPRAAFPGSYQAILIEQQVKANDALQTCRAAESTPLTVSG